MSIQTDILKRSRRPPKPIGVLSQAGQPRGNTGSTDCPQHRDCDPLRHLGASRITVPRADALNPVFSQCAASPSRVGGMELSAEPPRLTNTRRFLMDISTNRSAEAFGLLSPNVTYTVAGRSPMPGVFHGPPEVQDHIIKLLRVTAGTFQVLKWIDWLVGLTHVSALQFAQAQGRGMIYRGHHLFLVETDHNDLLVDIRLFFEDQFEADRFFKQIELE
jgi:hypothetical protein